MAPTSKKRKHSAIDSSSQHKIIIGIDFGTTYTGVSWASTEGSHLKTLSDIALVDDWPGPGRLGDYACKTPSRVAYGHQNDSLTNAFGFQVTPKMNCYAWMKLLLDPEQATKFDDPSLSQTEGSGVLNKPSHKTPVALCADFLAEVAKHAYNALAKRMNVDILETTEIEFWFSVPAVWSDRAKADTLRAAQMASSMAKLKFTQAAKIFLICEPEAAAIATLSDLSKGGSEQQIKSGDSVLICDCGGGTVDVTSYQIESLSPKLVFKELVAGIGGKCGSTYVDREFIKWMEHKFGKHYTTLNWDKRGPSSRLMKEFETIKRDFGKPSNFVDHELACIMKDADDGASYDADEGIIKISENDIQMFFKPVVDKIIELLQSQLDAERTQTGRVTIKTMILVGGFGDSVHINNVVGEWCQKAGIRLICPKEPQAAIVKGAALAGLLNIQPTSRRARRHYGYKLSEIFDPTQHSREDRFICSWDGTVRAKNCMTWSLAKGDVVDENTHLTCRVRIYVAERGDRQHTVSVYVSDDDVQPLNARQAGVRKLVDFNCDLTGVNLSKFESRGSHGRRTWQVNAQFRITFGARNGTLGFSCLINGKELGKTTVTFDGQDAGDGSVANNGSSACAVQ